MRSTLPPKTYSDLALSTLLGAILSAFTVCELRAADLTAPQGPAWQRHSISDPTLDGPDGTKLADIDGDRRLDVTTGFESEGATLVFRNPGPALVRQPWPAVAVGKTPRAEDAVFVDLDNDGALDVVTSSEQHVEQVFIQWGPSDKNSLFEAAAWRQASIDAARGKSMWMFAEPIRMTPNAPVGLVVGGKNYNRDQTALLGLLSPVSDPRQVDQYSWQPLTNLSWVMSIIVTDMNGDGYDDILYSDKHGPGCGVWWLENPATVDGTPTNLAHWKRHSVLHDNLDGCMLIDVVDVDRDGFEDIIAPVDHPRSHPGDSHEHRRIVLLRRLDKSGRNWEPIPIQVPPGAGQPKAVTAGDVNSDGRIDLVVTSSGADGPDIGAYWLEYSDSFREPVWTSHNIGGPEGIKYDLVHLIDLDEDGDLDVLTNEEKEEGRGLGVFWYENDLRPDKLQSSGSVPTPEVTKTTISPTKVVARSKEAVE